MLLVDNFLSIRQRTGTKVCQFNFTWKWLRQFFEEIETTEKGKRKRMHYDFELFSQVHQYFLKTVSCCGTESLNLSFISTELEPQRLHPLFFDLTCNLKELTVHTNNCSLGICDTMLCTSPKLEKLTLLSSKLNDREIFFMVYCLPSLKSLCLHSCTGLKKLALKSSSLEHLRIINEKVVELEEIVIHCPLQTQFVMWYPYPDASPAFRVVLSQLKEFVWHGFPLGYYFSLQSIHLQNASVHLVLPTKRALWELSQASMDLLDAVIDQLKTTKSLTCHGNAIWLRLLHFAATVLLVELSLLFICCHLCCFVFICCHLCNFDTTAPTVEKFVEEFGSSMEGSTGFNMEFWETQGLKFVPQLKTATIEVHLGNGVELVKYLLKHGRALETLDIQCFPGKESRILKEISGCLKKLAIKPLSAKFLKAATTNNMLKIIPKHPGPMLTNQIQMASIFWGFLIELDVKDG
ncbi:hypothetical protein SLEP1_g43118 [Rubroshorea leprosula]|uniref:F-box/LRR-repeat protein 15/At3g58940/PEG3-like LRR domain-containing protein n=1 Tax=Rubroshorea leprosula TaxID=152421 RepID=A0AAV5LCE6_9ROSI|nr:hypothetical protein SLEP1_g43118 [Rubroshorea leprosula]